MSRDQNFVNSTKHALEIFEKRINSNFETLRDIRNQFEDNESDEITKLIRNVNHAIDDVENMKTLELPSVASKAENLIEQFSTSEENKKKVGNILTDFKEALDTTSQCLEEWRDRMSDLDNAQHSFDADHIYILKLLENVEKVIAQESLSAMSDERVTLTKLKAARDQLEQGQERANRLKKSKFEVKTKRKELDHTLHQSENGSEAGNGSESDTKSDTSSIDNLTDRYMDLQDQLDLLIDEYSNAASLKDSINNLGEEIDIWLTKSS